MQNRANTVFAAAVLVCLIPAAGLALTPYSQNFEGMSPPSVGATLGDGWLVFGNVSDSGGNYLYGYGTFPAPNDGAAFCAVAVGEGGAEQGAQQLSVYSDYNNLDHGAGYLIEANVFQEQTVLAGNVGETWIFEFQAKRGNLEGTTTALAFIKTLDPGAGFALTNFVTVDMTAIPTTWGGYAVSLAIDASLVGQIFQIGFANTTTSYQGSGVFYDNVVFRLDDASSVPVGSLAAGATLRQNYPNPFNPSTRIEFVLDHPGTADVFVYDLAGRHVVTLHQGELGAGAHQVVWNGRTANGAAAPAGQYRYVLRTATGQVSRSMILLK